MQFQTLINQISRRTSNSVEPRPASSRASGVESFEQDLLERSPGIEFHRDGAQLKVYLENTLDEDRVVLGVVAPAKTDEVQCVVDLANKYGLPLYPISRGQNIGYGDRLPVEDRHVVVDLRKMNQIRDYNPTLGQVVIEPGVTQEQLCCFLRSAGDIYRADVTGAPLSSSIVGNCLDGGFGHSPLGNRRKTVMDMEVVLGNGEIIQTGSFPGLGPDAAGLFIQSNFGIVTALRVPLMRTPPYYESFVITVKNNKDIDPLLDALRLLRMNGTLNSLVHIGNAVRALVTTETLPEKFRHAPVSEEQAIEYQKSFFASVGRWTAIGALYGSRKEIRAKRSQIKSIVGDFAEVRFFSDNSLRRIKCCVNIANRLFPTKTKGLLRRIQALQEVHDLMQGIPCAKMSERISWRIEDRNTLGLIWFSPVLPAEGDVVRSFLHEVEKLFSEHKFEMPLTATLVDSGSLILVLNITFDKSNAAESIRAKSLYAELLAHANRFGVTPYRLGVSSMKESCGIPAERQELLTALKSALDPNNIIARGRYGITPGADNLSTLPKDPQPSHKTPSL